MRIVCLDDCRPDLDRVLSLCREIPRVREIEGFERPRDLLDRLGDKRADVALLDIRMPEMDGLALMEKLREKDPDLAVIFVTAHPEYAVEAFRLHASGYIVKPAAGERLASELDYAMAGRRMRGNVPHISVRAFGDFEVFVDGEAVRFPRTRARDLLAYLVGLRGRSVSRAEAFSVLWHGGYYDRSMQKQLDVVIRSLRDVLGKYEIEDIFDLKRGSMRIFPEKLDCDLYRFLDEGAEISGKREGEQVNPFCRAGMTEA